MGRRKKIEEKEGLKLSPPKLNLSGETKRGIAVVIFIALALVTVLSIAGIAGTLGQELFKILSSIFGVMTYVVPLILISVAISLYKQDLEAEGRDHSFYWRTYLGAILMTGSIGGLIHIFYYAQPVNGFDLASSGGGGGYLGALFAQPLFSLLGFWAGSLVLITLIVIGVLVTFDLSLRIMVTWYIFTSVVDI